MKKILTSLFVGVMMFSITPNVLANTYTNEDETNTNSEYNMDTTYEAYTYVEPVDTYDIDLEWDDLHWVFIYEGDITNPTKSIWLTKANYDSNRNNASVNEFNGTILSNINSYSDLDVTNIEVTNNSGFAVGVVATVEDAINAENYTSGANLKVAKLGDTAFASQANLSLSSTNGSGSFLVKPTATRFVNDTGVTTNVTGELKLTFTKAN